MSIREKLIVLSILKQGDWVSMYQALKEDLSLSSLEDEEVDFYLSQLGSLGVITIFDDLYPEAFREMSMSPFVLFFQGDVSLLEKQKIGVVGGKVVSDYGFKSCQRILPPLFHADCVLISGLQPGIERISNQIGMKKGKNILILSSGFNQIYPKENQELYQLLVQNHLVLTEYPLDVSVSWRQYYRSYRLMQNLSDVTLVMEVPSEDKRLPDLKAMLYDGKPIFVLPNRNDSLNARGGLSLINEGAYCLINSEDVLKVL